MNVAEPKSISRMSVHSRTRLGVGDALRCVDRSLSTLLDQNEDKYLSGWDKLH